MIQSPSRVLSLSLSSSLSIYRVPLSYLSNLNTAKSMPRDPLPIYHAPSSDHTCKLPIACHVISYHPSHIVVSTNSITMFINVNRVDWRWTNLNTVDNEVEGKGKGTAYLQEYGNKTRKCLSTHSLILSTNRCAHLEVHSKLNVKCARNEVT